MTLHQLVGAWLMFAAGFVAASVCGVAATLALLFKEDRRGGGCGGGCRNGAGRHGCKAAPPQDAARASSGWWDCFHE